MNCGKARKVIYLADRLSSASTGWVEAQGHLQGCPLCRRFFSDEEALAAFLRERSSRTPAPPHLREKILAQMARKRPIVSEGLAIRGRRRVRLAALLLFISALVLLGGIAGYQVLTRDWQERMVAELIDDHVRFQPGAYEITSPQADQVEAWFSGKVDFAVQAPRFEQVELLGGRLCYLSGKKGALLSYRKQDTLISFYILDGSDVSLDRFNRREWGHETLALESDRGQSLILWKDRGLAYALVSDLPEEELVRMALAARRGKV